MTNEEIKQTEYFTCVMISLIGIDGLRKNKINKIIIKPKKSSSNQFGESVVCEQANPEYIMFLLSTYNTKFVNTASELVAVREDYVLKSNEEGEQDNE